MTNRISSTEFVFVKKKNKRKLCTVNCFSPLNINRVPEKIMKTNEYAYFNLFYHELKKITL